MTGARVLVTDGERASALAVIRSLGRAGHEVIAASTRADSVGGASRYTTATGTYPPPEDGASRTAAAIGDIARLHGVDLIVPVTDDTIVPLTRHRDALPPTCRVAVADDPALETAASKIATIGLADRLGVPVPDHEVVTDPGAARGCTRRLGRPVVVKPDRSRILDDEGRLRRGPVRYAWTDEEAAEAVRVAGQPVLLERHHPGQGVGIGMVLDRGRPVAAVQHRRLHEVPVSGGASSLRETEPLDPVLLGHSSELLGALRWTGAAMVEVKVGPAGPALMEVNGRLWGSLPLAVRAGADIPRHLVAVHLGRHDRDVACDTGYDHGVRARNLDLELVWIGSVLARGDRTGLTEVRRRDGLSAVTDLVRPGQGDDLLAADDRRPVVTGVRHALVHAARKVVRA